MQVKAGVVRAMVMRSGRRLQMALVGTFLWVLACAPDLPDDLPALVQLMASNDMDLHTHAARKVFDQYGVDGLIEALQSSSPGARRQAARFIRLHPEAKARAPIMKATRDEDPTVRAWATFALMSYPDAGARSRLAELLSDPDPLVRSRAKEALDAVGSLAQ